MNKSIEAAWKDFPLLSQKIEGKGFAYLDSAATTLKPWPVIERVSRFLTFETANVHRGAYRLSDKATQNFEQVRSDVASFIGAKDRSEIIFTKGTTESINLFANTLAESWVQSGDAVLVTELDHHSNWVPWQRLCEKVGAKFLVLPTNTQGDLDLDELQAIIKKHRVKVVAFTAMSNALGVMTPIREIAVLAKKAGALVCLDAAQWVSYDSLDVTDLGIDMMAFSGHKLFAPYGVGVAFIQKDLASQLPPYQGGGSMVDQVGIEQTSYLDSPHRFEAGTPNIEGVLGLGAALTYFKQFSYADIHRYEASLTQQLVEGLKALGGVTLYGDVPNKGPIVSFSLNQVHASDVAHLLNEENVFVRSGHHCCQPLMRRLGVTGTLRASISIYNQPKDIERLLIALKKAQEILV